MHLSLSRIYNVTRSLFTFALIVTVAFFSYPTNSQASTNISDCGTLGVEGETYVLTQDIPAAAVAGNGCFEVTANNITIDGGGFTVTYNSGPQVGVYAVGTVADGFDVTIKNITLDGFGTAAVNASGLNGAVGGDGAAGNAGAAGEGGAMPQSGADGSGGENGAAGTNGGLGGDIFIDNVTFANGAIINTLGGNGGNGGAGGVGGSGGAGGNGTFGATGGNGGAGGAGGSGGAGGVGGNGGFVTVRNSTVSDINTVGGTGGNGGNAGIGGSGGAGGSGGSGSVPGGSGGNGGNGGPGGSGSAGGVGGNGGNGGSYTIFSNASASIITATGGAGGAGGDSSAGGSGANGGGAGSGDSDNGGTDGINGNGGDGGTGGGSNATLGQFASGDQGGAGGAAGDDGAAGSNGSAGSSVPADETAPTVLDVTSDKANGQYTVGEVISIYVTFSEAVTSTGNVTVTLETGATDRTCTFTVSTETIGTCNYTVQAGDTSPDLTVNSITGNVADAAANVMTSPATPATNLAANKALVIDTTAPTVSITAPTEGATVSGSAVSITANASDTNTIVGVQFKRATNTNIGAEDTTSTYGVTWDTTALSDGAQSLLAVARDTAGNYATSTAVSVTVTNTVASGGSGGGGGSSSSDIDVSCEVTDETPEVGDEVDFEVDIDADDYTFSWTSVLSGRDETTSYTFTNTGRFYPRGQVRTDDGNITVNCGTITVSDDGDENDEEVDDDTNTEDIDEDDEEDDNGTVTDEVKTLIEANSVFLLGLLSQGIDLPQFVRDILKDLLTHTTTDTPTLFTVNLELGMDHPDVLRLQQFLNTRGFTVASSGPGSAGNETTFFGAGTQNALIRFQVAHTITPAIGFFGPVTRAFVEGL